MTSQEILKADPLDILFDNRNKQYGAYVLRKNYNGRLGAALAICLSTILLFFFLFRPDRMKDDAGGSGEEVIVRDFIPPQEIKQPDVRVQERTESRQEVAHRKYTDRIEIVANEKKLQDFATQDELTGAVPGIADSKGIPFTGQTIPEMPGVVGADKPGVTETTPLVQSEPEFPGGTRAWLGFLNKNLRVPGDLGEGEKKTVLIRFQVAGDGSVTGFEVLQSGGNIYDNEVIRVLKKMPKWKPAIQNNVPVARSFTQPVTFMGVSE